MRSLLKLFGLIFVLVVGAGAVIYFTGNTFKVAVWVFAPHHEFDLSLKAPAPDYAEAKNWAALPETNDLADLTPEGIAPREAPAQVDVFFIHPTGFLHGSEWNSSMDPNSNTEENTKWMMANQASAFNGAGNIYAPRYREASIFAYMVGDPEVMKKALDFAYQDVERAFDYFLANRSEGRPFIIASHSQGTQHGLTLLANRISGTPLRQRMVAAYLIGGGITKKNMDEITDIGMCDAPDDLHCVIHWATFGPDGKLDVDLGDTALVCTNPLTWRNDGPEASADLHQGAVETSGRFSVNPWKKNISQDIEFGPLGQPEPGLSWAKCEGGLLKVADQSNGFYQKATGLPGQNYHGHDYPFFHMDIRHNAERRVEAYLAR